MKNDNLKHFNGVRFSLFVTQEAKTWYENGEILVGHIMTN
jgi:hypothetical protein